MKKQNLKEFLEELNETEMIYLGAKNGSEWFEIAEAGEILKNMSKLDKELKNDAKKRLTRAETILKKRSKEIHDIYQKIDEGGLTKKELKELDSKLNDKSNEFSNAYRQKATYSKVLLAWTKLEDRPVEESYIHETDTVGTAVLVKGIDQGKYVMISERMRDKTRK